MRPFRFCDALGVALLTSLLPAIATVQWLNYPAPGTPRLPDGKPNLSAPAPRTPDGKPDLSGVWRGADLSIDSILLRISNPKISNPGRRRSSSSACEIHDGTARWQRVFPSAFSRQRSLP
jgi:hypothetical protein